MDIDLQTITLEQFTQLIGQHITAHEWDQALELNHYLVCNRYGEFSPEQKEKLRLVVQPAFIAKEAESIAAEAAKQAARLARLMAKAIPKKKQKAKKKKKAEKKAKKRRQKRYPPGLWGEVLRASEELLIQALRKELTENTWLPNQFALLEKRLEKKSVKKRAAAVDTFLEACEKAVAEDTLSREILFPILSVFYVDDRDLIDKKKMIAFVADLGIQPETSHSHDDDESD